MRAVWSLILIAGGSVYALSISKNGGEPSKPILSLNNTDNDLNSQCSQFVKRCLESCEKETINNFSTTCSSRSATCSCNDVDISSKIFNTLLQGVPGAIITDKKKLQVENNKNKVKDFMKPVQFNAVLGDVDQGEEAEQLEPDPLENDEEMGESSDYSGPVGSRDYQNMEFIHPNPRLVKNTVFQENYCSRFLVRCKQDCPAAFNSYSCETNLQETGFFLTCVCNTVDIAASVDAQVQAEM